MSQDDLLSAVQAPDGYFAILGLGGSTRTRQKLVATREEFDETVEAFLQAEQNVYFGVAKFETDENRLKDNVKSLKAFWLDIDCGDDKAKKDPKTGKAKGYPDQAAGLLALKVFCKIAGLPRPIVVNSGRGLHIYWPLAEAVTRAQWEPVAHALGALCVTHGLLVDPSVTTDVARVLRVPGTWNFKDDPPSQVEVAYWGKPIAFEAFCTLLGATPTPPSTPLVSTPGRELSPLAQKLRENIVCRFSTILERSENGNGCQQLLDCHENRATLAEPRWFDALSVANLCVDREEAISLVSEEYPGYTFAAADAKAAHAGGPHSCKVFERNNPGGCDGCPHLDKITTPIQLGREFIKEEPTSDEEGVGDPTTYDIAPPYELSNGQIVYMDDKVGPVVVCKVPLIVVKRMDDPTHGDVVVLKLITPSDGVREFTIQNKLLSNKIELRGILASRGLLFVEEKAFNQVIKYIYTCTDYLWIKRKAQVMRTQFGWADNDKKFILGTKEISRDGVSYSPPANTTAKFADMLNSKGTFEKWREVFNLFGRPGLEAHAFAALTAFGAPLLRFLGQKGAIVNVIHPTSGTGKTTILHMCNSVWGSPAGLCGIGEDTFNSKVQRLGVLRNLPYCVDEMTNLPAKDFSPLIYNMSQGRGKDRMTRSGNDLRNNVTTWETISLCSSNASFQEKMNSIKDNPDGEMMRLLEYSISPSSAIDVALGKKMFDHQLLENYGHAGEKYITHVVNNLDTILPKLMEFQVKLDSELRLTSRERFWSSVVACNMFGGRLAMRLDLFDWDAKPIYNFATDMLMGMRKDIAPPLSDVGTIIGSYINASMQNIVVVNDAVDARSNRFALPVLEPRGELNIRYEPDTKKMYLAVGPFRTFCSIRQINFKETVKELENKGIYIGRDLKRLSKGMKITSPGVNCLVLDCTAHDFMDVESILPTEAPSVSGAG